MDSLVAGGKVAPRGGYSHELLAFRGDQFHFRANGVAVALVSHQLQRKPEAVGGSFVVQDVRRAGVGGHYCIEASVIVTVTNGHSARCPRLLKHLSGGCRDVNDTAT